MNRVSSATGYNERDLNNTRFFWSQDGIPLLLTVLVVAFLVVMPSGCRRSSKPKAEGASTTERNAAERLPERTAPPPPPSIPAADTVAPQPIGHRGGVVRVHIDAEPAHLNPLADPDASALQVVMGLIYEPLITCPSPEAASAGYRPALAESWQVAPDGDRISLRLRPGVRWHDGRPLTVLDVQASLEPLLLASGTTNPFIRNSVQDIAAIELAQERTVRLVLKRPSDYALRALCDVPILPDHLLRGPTADVNGLGRQPVGTGPYRFGAWEKGRRIRLTRANAYWGSAPGALDELVFEIDADGAHALMRTRRGEIDILPRILPVHYPNDVDPVTLHGTLDLVRSRPERWAYVAVNHRRAPLDDPKYRTALSALWDRERFARDLHQALARPLAGPPFAEGVSLPMVGRAAAAKALEQANYRDSNADGVRDVGGNPFRHTLLIASGARAAATEAHAFVFEARKAGLLIDLVSVDAATLLARVRKGDFDLALLSWEGLPDENPALMFGSGGPYNYSGYRSTEADALLDRLRHAAGPAARRPLLAELGSLLARDQPVLFLYRFDVPALVAHRVRGLAANGGYLDLRGVWVAP